MKQLLEQGEGKGGGGRDHPHDIAKMILSSQFSKQ